MLERIIKAIEKRRPDDKSRSGAKRWWHWPALILLVLVGLAVATWLGTRHRRELAKLRHQRFKREEEARQAEMKVAIAENQLAKDKALKKAEVARKRAASADAKMTKAVARYEKDKHRIAKLRWGDLPRGD